MKYNGKDFKITKNKYYRVNFKYDGKHYSIQQTGELYEEYVMLTCKEDKEFFFNIGYTFLYEIYLNPGMTYGQADMSKIHEVIDKYIE